MVKQLGIIGEISDIDVIEKYIKKWSPRKIVNKAAKEAIELLRKE